MIRNLGPSVLLAALLVAPGRAGADESLDAAMASIRPEAIEAHMRFLAHDLLEGRETGTRGYRLAAEYVASQYRLLGLDPAGDDGTYFQWVDFRRAVQVPGTCALVLEDGDHARTLEYATHFLTGGNTVVEESSVTAPLVFVGYGVTAPDAGYDDYAGMDVEGKIVVLLRGAPPTFDHNQRAYYASSRVKYANAADRGAVGVFRFLTPEDAATRPWERSVQNSGIARMRWIGDDGVVRGVNPSLEASAFLSPDGVETVFEGAETPLEDMLADLAEGRPHSLDLAWRARFTATSRHAEVRSANVAGILPGSDPTLGHETVVFTAHLDHLGVGEPVDGDTIYNGAYDNASGTAVLLEMARAFRSLPRAPRRSILFLAVTGEEKGLLGSEYFCENPTVPIDDIVANVNLDMFLMLHPLCDVIAFGAEHSTLAGTVEEAASAMGLAVSPDPMPEEVIFVRSDQYNFVRHGVPAVFLVGGSLGASEAPEGGVDALTWRKEYYHSRRDDLGQYFDFQAGVDFARTNFLIGSKLAGRDERPRWNPGDFFGEKFARPDRGPGMD